MLWQMFVPENARFINEVFKMVEKNCVHLWNIAIFVCSFFCAAPRVSCRICVIQDLINWNNVITLNDAIFVVVFD